MPPLPEPGRGPGRRSGGGERLGLDELREVLAKEIEELERRLQLYRSLLEALEECSAARAAGLAGGRGTEYRSPDGRLVARLVEGNDTLTLVFYTPVPETHPYVKYMLTALERLQEEYEGLEYSVDSDDGYVKTVTVMGVDKDSRDEVKAVLEFAAKKIASPRRRLRGPQG